MKDIFKNHEIETFEGIAKIAFENNLGVTRPTNQPDNRVFVWYHNNIIFKFEEHLINTHYVLVWHDAELLEAI